MNDLIEKDICDQIVLEITSEREAKDQIKCTPRLAYHSIEFFNIPSLRVKCTKTKKYLMLKNSFEPLLNNYTFLNIERVKSEDPWIRILINSYEDIKLLGSFFLQLYDETYLLGNVEIFSCCSRYVQCSDERKCVQPDKLLAMGCSYGKHLKKGRIFYGKNRNV